MTWTEECIRAMKWHINRLKFREIAESDEPYQIESSWFYNEESRPSFRKWSARVDAFQKTGVWSNDASVPPL